MAILLGISGYILQSCNTKHRIWVGENNEQKIFNLKYGEHKRQKMDIFLPSEYDSNTPTVVMVHGGGWQFGRKESMIHIQKFLYKNNIPTVNISYRYVGDGITYKDQLKDISSAIGKFNTLVEKAKLQPNNYIILGESAGGHLSLLYGYQHPEQIKKIISLSGPTDFYTKKYLGSFYSKYSSPTVQKMVGKKFDRDNLPEEYQLASPIYHVSNVPTLMFQGNRDFLVNQTQAKTLDSVLAKNNIEHKLVYLDKSGHLTRFFSKKKRDQIIYPNILDWIKK